MQKGGALFNPLIPGGNKKLYELNKPAVNSCRFV